MRHNRAPNLKGDIMEIAAVFIAFLAPFFALIAGLALVTFSPLKRVSQPKKLLLTGLSAGGCTALGWTPVLLTGGIRTWVYLAVVGISILYGTLIILFVTSEILPEKMTDEPADGSLRAQHHHIF
jgi:hypothetical protein